MTRLILTSVLFLLSLLTLFRAPTNFFWYVAIVVSEFSWIFLAGLLLVCLCFPLLPGWKILSWSLTITSVLLYLYPIVAAYAISSDLNKQIEKAFPPSPLPVSVSVPVPVSVPVSVPVPVSVSPAYSFHRSLTGIFDKQILPRKIQYDSTEKLNFDLFAIGDGRFKPCILVVHGGSWAGGSSEQIPELNSSLARLGYAVAAINYRLAPQHHFPAQMEDVLHALTYLRIHADELQINMNKVVLLGRSAGAQIALAAAYRVPVPGLKGVISFYGPADMVWGYSAPANPLVLDSKKVMEDYLGGTYGQVPDNYKKSSPIEFVTPVSVPTLLIHGKNDPLVAYEHTVR
ncbi:MAG TPA: alpha/beta hydrolase, partial [Flavitalea sp.]|nr:alpha/beta hydrolase [Flavitalea sp.]